MAVPFGWQWATWNDVPVGMQNELLDLKNQWENLVGYRWDVSNDMLLDMANNHVGSLSTFGQFMASFGLVPQQYYWAAYGLTQDEYQSRMNQYWNTWMQLTGQMLFVNNPGLDYANGMMVNDWFKKGMTAADVMQMMKTDPRFLNQYGWLKYGLDYQQFQQQKLQMNPLFGTTLTDQQAVQQLQYLHTNQGSDQTVRQQATLTQVEKQSANIGTAQSQVR